MVENNRRLLSTGNSIYWLTDCRKKSDVIDLGIADTYLDIVIKFGLIIQPFSSNHYIVCMFSVIWPELNIKRQTRNWDTFREKNTHQNKTKKHPEIIINELNYTIQEAAWMSIPDNELRDRRMDCSRNVKIKIDEKEN